jgi:hypothetical protein
MKTIQYCVRLLWWLGAAAIPVAQYRFYEYYRRAIECPAYGDCYTTGSEHLDGMELLIAFSAVTVWPLFIYYVIVKPWRSRFVRRHAGETDARPTD